MSSKKGGLADLKRLARQAKDEAERQASHAARQAAAAQARRVASGQSGRAEMTGSPGRADAIPASDPSAAERALFRRLAGPVAPVDTRNRLLHTPSSPRPAPPPAPLRQNSPDRVPSNRPAPPAARADAGLSDGDVSHLLREDGTAFLRAGMGEAVLKKLQTRGWRIEADLDLHGMTVDQARARLADFILQCVAYDARCVRIVHGKGYNSPNGQSVLRDRVQAWLVGSGDVRAFVQASERDGGAGATLALLGVDDRRARDRRAPSGNR